MAFEALGLLSDSAKIQYIHTLLQGAALHQIEDLCAEVGSTTTTNLNHIILGLGSYFVLLMRCQSKSARCATEKGSRLN